jgi:hypothetical protein
MIVRLRVGDIALYDMEVDDRFWETQPDSLVADDERKRETLARPPMQRHGEGHAGRRDPLNWQHVLARSGGRKGRRCRENPTRQCLLNWARRAVAQPEHRRNIQLEAAVDRQLTGHRISDRLEVPFCFRLQLNVSRKRLNPGVLKREAMHPDHANQFDRANAVCLLRENQVTPRRAFPHLDVA